MGCSSATKVMLYYDPHAHIMKISNHAYFDEHDIRIHPKEHLAPGSLLLHYYPNKKYSPDLTAPSYMKLV